MIKKLVSTVSILLCMSLFMSFMASASPSVINPYETGNSDSLLYIKKPAARSVTTSERTYTVTAAGEPGVEVTVYRKSYYDGNFYRVYQGGYMLEDTIGASGVYVVSIELYEGGNKMLIRGESADGSEVQIVKIDITRVSPSQIERINNLSIGDLFNAYNG